jgi:UDP-3-O-[3-hydroxymyristoyl] glucosamine N-acyltransferase
MIIYFFDYNSLGTDEKWKSFESTESGFEKELEMRNIKIGKDVHFGRGVMLGNGIEIGDNTIIGDGTKIYDDTIIGNDVLIYDRVYISYRVHIGNKTRIDDQVRISNNVIIEEEAYIYCNSIIHRSVYIEKAATIGLGTCIYPCAHIGRDSNINKHSVIGTKATIEDRSNPLIVSFAESMYSVSYWGEDKVAIGCQVKTIDEWLDNHKEIAKKYGFDKTRTAKYLGYLRVIKLLHKMNMKAKNKELT